MLVSFLLLIGILQVLGAASQSRRLFDDKSTSSCSVLTYDSQPTFEIPCNPYASNTSDDISLKCSINGPAVISSNMSFGVKWSRILQSNDERQDLSDIAESRADLVRIDDRIITTSQAQDSITLQSILTLNDVISNDVAGVYWCQVSLRSGTPPESIDEKLSDVGPVTMIRTPAAYLDLDECQNDFIFTSKTKSVVTFEGLQCATTSVTTQNTEKPPTGEEVVISKQLLIIIGAIVGGVVFVVIHVLMMMVCCLCYQKNHKVQKMQKRDYAPHYISTTSLVSTPPSPPQILNIMASPPKQPPPRPKKKPAVPHRSTLPPRFTCQVFTPETTEEQEEYAPVHQPGRHHQYRAATISEGIHTISTPAKRTDEALQLEEHHKYKSLNRDMMDDHPVYEDPCSRQTSIDEDNSSVSDHGSVAFGAKDSNMPLPRRFMSRHMTGLVSPVVRESVDGEYIVPNEAFNSNNNVLMSPIDSDEQPDYMDIMSY